MKILDASRTTKRIVTAGIDACIIAFAFWLAQFLRIENTAILFNTQYWLALLIVIPFSIALFVRLGLYRAVIRSISLAAFGGALLAGAVVSTGVLLFTDYFFDINFPKTIPVIYFVLLLSAVGGSRMVLRAFILYAAQANKRPIIIYGAGSAGQQLALGLANGPEYRPVAFIDDDEQIHGTIIQGISVIGINELDTFLKTQKVEKILLALPSVKRSVRKKVLSELEPFSIKVQTIPGIADVIEGKAHKDDIQDVDIEDLLGRDPVTPHEDLIRANIQNQVVMVTGAGGSIGSELCRQIVQNGPKTLILFEISEYALYAIDRELNDFVAENQLSVEIVPLLGSVQRINRLENVMSAFGVETVYHAAAYKHVPLVENNIVEGVRNNIFGTMYCAQAAINAKVPTFVLVSTDKAVRPTNVMGTTKRMAELVLQALSKTQNTTRFTMVRFGNVLGSSGSVVPLFRKQILAGGPVTLTHNEITRYFMTIPEAAQLVIQAGAMGKGGDVFVLDMGEPVKIRDLAAKLIRLSGLEVKSEHNPHGDIEIKCTGLRPGEKLYEELLIGDNVEKTTHQRIMTASEVMLPWNKLNTIIKALDTACHDFDHEQIRALLLDAPTAYSPNDPIVDLLYLAKKNAPHQPQDDNVIILHNKKGA